jgi:hypothetical protein
MVGILKAIKEDQKKCLERNFDRSYYFVDIHSTIVKSNYDSKSIPTEFYPFAKETLQYMSKLNPRIKLILYTCSHPKEIDLYLNFFRKNDIYFQYVNKNPEVQTDKNGYGCYDDKPYISVLFDDKAGFDAEEDWEPTLGLLKEIYEIT